ncbi:hypothetical protein AB0910_09180 [Streptomyces sp. NPDC047002]|uniref:hypothetical protein n=1 Tax=Streptomyces sp. NPDC047002 TaxID=3155475 RepID=UPI0034512C9D
MPVASRSAAFRPLVTAGAAGVMLCGLFFVPSAHGEGQRGETPHKDGRTAVSTGLVHGDRDTAAAAQGSAPGGEGPAPDAGAGAPGARASRQLALGEAPASDATPYVIGAAGVLCVGAGYGARVVRRRSGAA